MKIVHLRQNLEKVPCCTVGCRACIHTHPIVFLSSFPTYLLLLQARNLAYMIQRRERLKKQELRSRAELFQVESQLLEEEADEEYEREAKRARMEEGEGEEEEGGLPAMENHLDLRPGMEYLGPTLRINDILSRYVCGVVCEIDLSLMYCSLLGM